MDKIESALESAAMEFDPTELERCYCEAWEATCKVLRPVHPARFKVHLSYMYGLQYYGI